MVGGSASSVKKYGTSQKRQALVKMGGNTARLVGVKLQKKNLLLTKNRGDIMGKFREGDTVKYIPSGYTFVVESANTVNAQDNQRHWYECEHLEIISRKLTYEELEERNMQLEDAIFAIDGAAVLLATSNEHLGHDDVAEIRKICYSTKEKEEVEVRTTNTRFNYPKGEPNKSASKFPPLETIYP